MSGIAIITEAWIGTKDRACVDVCPVGAIYSEERVPDGATRISYNATDTSKGHDHTFLVQLTRVVFAD